jgi:hypothetical protein
MKKISIFLLAFLFLTIGVARAEELSVRLKGKILLQVESHGEAWYVNPDTQKRFYLGRPADAFNVMREQGLGISNKDFNLFAGIAPARLAGKILLKVESKGEAYFVNPVDLKMHYLGCPSDAFSVMKNLGLGITNNNLALISVDEKSSPIILKLMEEIKATPEPSDAEAMEGEEKEEMEIATSTEEIIIETPDLPAGQAGEIATSTEEVVADLPAGQAGETATTTCVWLAEYFSNKSVFGVPVATSTVNKINFDWGISGPENLNKINSFSARFTTNCNFIGGNYEFQTKYDDAIKVYLDNENFLQSWADNNGKKTFNRERNVSAGVHEVKVEYYDATGNASISVDWVKISS